MKKKKKIMIVDDEWDVVDVVKKMLKSEGYEVIGAHSGKECLEKMNEGVDMVLLDILMPEMDGWETLKKIKENEKFASTPISMLTALPLTPEDTKNKPIQLIENYIIKPFTKKELVEKVGEILGREEEIKEIVRELEEKVGKDVANEYERLSMAVDRHSRLTDAIVESVKGKGKISQSVKNVIKSQERMIQINEERIKEIEKMIK